MTAPVEGQQPPATGPSTDGSPLFTQDQVNHFNAEAKRTAVNAYFRELGLDRPLTADEFKNLTTNATEFKKLQDGKKDEVTRLNEQLTTVTEKANRVPALEAELTKAKLAAEAGLKPRYWKYVEGTTEDEIKASITETLKDFSPGDGQQQEQQQPEGGAQQQQGTPLAPNPLQGTGGANGGGKVTSTMAAGMDAYAKRHGKKE